MLILVYKWEFTLRPTPCPVAVGAARERCSLAAQPARPRRSARAVAVDTNDLSSIFVLGQPASACRVPSKGLVGAAGDAWRDAWRQVWPTRVEGRHTAARGQNQPALGGSHRLCTASDHHPRCCDCWAALCLTFGPLLSPKTIWMPIRQSTVIRPGLRLSPSQKKDEPSRVFPRPRHHAIPKRVIGSWPGRLRVRTAATAAQHVACSHSRRPLLPTRRLLTLPSRSTTPCTR